MPKMGIDMHTPTKGTHVLARQDHLKYTPTSHQIPGVEIHPNSQKIIM